MDSPPSSGGKPPVASRKKAQVVSVYALSGLSAIFFLIEELLRRVAAGPGVAWRRYRGPWNITYVATTVTRHCWVLSLTQVFFCKNFSHIYRCRQIWHLRLALQSTIGAPNTQNLGWFCVESCMHLSWSIHIYIYTYFCTKFF